MVDNKRRCFQGPSKQYARFEESIKSWRKVQPKLRIVEKIDELRNEG